MADRGRVWIGVTPQGRPSLTEIRLATHPQLLQARPGTVPFQQAVSPDTLVFAFDDRPGQPPGPYLGQFKVTATNENFATLVPTLQLSPEEFKRLQSPGPWSLYEQMPLDNQQSFAGLDPQDLAALLPKESVPDYQRQRRQGPGQRSAGRRVDARGVHEAQELDSDAGKVAYEPGETLQLDRSSAEQLIRQGSSRGAQRRGGLELLSAAATGLCLPVSRVLSPALRPANRLDPRQGQSRVDPVGAGRCPEGRPIPPGDDRRSAVRPQASAARDAAVAKAYAAKLEAALTRSRPRSTRSAKPTASWQPNWPRGNFRPRSGSRSRWRPR